MEPAASSRALQLASLRATATAEVEACRLAELVGLAEVASELLQVLTACRSIAVAGASLPACTAATSWRRLAARLLDRDRKRA